MAHWPRIIAPHAPAGNIPAPLRGAKILCTRPEESGDTLAEALAAAGAEVRIAPAIEFRDLAGRNLEVFLESLDHLRHWQGWLILPSPQAARSFGKLLEITGLTPAALAGTRIATIGPASAAALGAIGLAVDHLPPQSSAASLAASLPASGGTPVLIAGSSQSRPELQDGLKRRGLRVQFLTLYETCPCEAGLRAIEQTLGKHPESLVLAASPSAAEAITDWYDQQERPRPAARWLAIGPTTYRRLLDLGISPVDTASAPSPDAAGVIAAAADLLARPWPAEGSAS